MRYEACKEVRRVRLAIRPSGVSLFLDGHPKASDDTTDFLSLCEKDREFAFREVLKVTRQVELCAKFCAGSFGGGKGTVEFGTRGPFEALSDI